MTLRIAMWSGPRNISTAMMRAWENRQDTIVWDEPLYAHYLAETGLDHPGREAIIAAGETDWQKVVSTCSKSITDNKAIFYQKHMSHHLLPHIGRDWLNRVTHCFLLRDPRLVLKSYVKTRENVTLDDIGLSQQLEIFEQVRSVTGERPIVIDSADFLRNPRQYLAALCNQLGISFSERMLSWPAGPRDSDGIWAQYWYTTVWRSTGFSAYRPSDPSLPEHLQSLADQAMPYYQTLYAERLVL